MSKILFLCPVFLPLLKFVIGHIARYAPSSKFQNQQKYRSKLLNLTFHHYLLVFQKRLCVVDGRFGQFLSAQHICNFADAFIVVQAGDVA